MVFVFQLKAVVAHSVILVSVLQVIQNAGSFAYERLPDLSYTPKELGDQER